MSKEAEYCFRYRSSAAGLGGDLSVNDKARHRDFGRRVLIFVPTLQVGGAERTAVELANFLTNTWKVSLVTYEANESFYPVRPEVDRHSLARSRIERLLGPIGVVLSLRRTARMSGADVCVGYSLNAAIAAAIGCIGLATRAVVCERSDPRRYAWPRRAVAKLAWRISNGAVFQSDYAAAYYAHRSRRNFVVANLLDEASLGEVHTTRSDHILFVGRLEPVKDPLAALRGFLELACERPGLRLVFVGEGSLRPQLEAEVCRTGMVERVDFVGNVKNVCSFYQRARMLVSTSLAEGYPNAILEAAAMGVPVVARDCPTHVQSSIIGEDCGIVYEATESEALPGAMRRVLEDDDFLARAISEAPAVRQRHSAGVVLPQWLSVLEEVMSE